MAFIQQREIRACFLRMPPWFKRRLSESEQAITFRKWLRANRLHTVCESAGCPNRTECFDRHIATFLILGNICTRGCRFCGVSKGIPHALDPDEPERIGLAVKALQCRYVVVTSVTRDDLEDGGAGAFRDTVLAIQKHAPEVFVETLIPDFRGKTEGVKAILEAGIYVLSHNIETVPRLYPKVRPEADFERSLKVLASSKRFLSSGWTKSGLMLGMGETWDEVVETLKALREIGCDIITLGQYLPPHGDAYPVSRYISPVEFEEYKKVAISLGFQFVYSGPRVRSSYHAEEMIPGMK